MLQRALELETRIGAHALSHTGSESAVEPAYCLPGALTRPLEAELQRLARLVWRVLECRDFARLDFRLDSDDRPLFLEINPLPTFAVDGTFAIPQYVLDTPYGKVPLDHPWARGRDGDDFVVETWTGQLWREPNPPD